MKGWRVHDLDARQKWPLIDPVLVDRDLAAVAASVLELARTDWTADVEIDVARPAARQFLEQHRVTTLVPLGAVSDRHRDWLRRSHIEIAASQLRLRSAATNLLKLLATHGFEVRVLKGLASSELDYPVPTLRHTGDVDIAIRHEDLDPMRELLVAHGYRDHPTPFSPYLLYGWTFEAPDGVEIDVHTRLFRRSPFGSHLFDAAGESMATLDGAALDVDKRLVHAAGHFMISPPGTRRMSGLIDVARMLQQPQLDLERARRFAAAIGVESLVGAGIRLEALLSDRTQVLAQLDTWKPPDLIERSTRLVPHRRLLLDHFARYKEVPPGHRLRYLPTWLLPDRRQRRLFVGSLADGVRSIRGAMGRQ